MENKKDFTIEEMTKFIEDIWNTKAPKREIIANTGSGGAIKFLETLRGRPVTDEERPKLEAIYPQGYWYTIKSSGIVMSNPNEDIPNGAMLVQRGDYYLLELWMDNVRDQYKLVSKEDFDRMMEMGDVKPIKLKDYEEE